MSYVIVSKQNRHPDKPLYFVKYSYYQDSPSEGSWKIFRTAWLADAALFGDRQEAEEMLEEFGWSPGWSIDYVLDSQVESAKREKFKGTLAGDYVPRSYRG